MEKYNNELLKLLDLIHDDKHVIIIGHSASGKDTLQHQFTNTLSVMPLISTTTRPIRDNETDGVDYHFVTEEEFADRNMIDRRSFLTVGEDNPWYYGFDAKAAITSRVSVLDLAGAKNLIQFYVLKGMPAPVILYIDEDIKVCRERYIKRGGTAAEFDRRYEADKGWQEEAKQLAQILYKDNKITRLRGSLREDN